MSLGPLKFNERWPWRVAQDQRTNESQAESAANAAPQPSVASRPCALSDIDVLNIARLIDPDPACVAAWYRSDPILTLGGLTAWQLVRAGHIGALVDFLRAIQLEVDG